MRIVLPAEWSGDKQSLEQAVQAFKAAREAHRFTEGVPAPMADQIVEELAAREVPFTLASDLPVAPPAAEVDPALVDQALSDRWVLDYLARQLAAEKDAPDYLVRHAERLR